MSQCPACARVNADRALACEACGTPLVMRCPACNTINVRSRVRCHHCAAMLDPSVRPQSVAPGEPLPAAEVVPTLADDDVPADWVLGLRDEALPQAAGPGAAHAASGWPALPPLPVLEDWPADPDAPVIAPVIAPAPPAAAPASTTPPAVAPEVRPEVAPESLAERKVRRRAAVRAAQMRSRAPAAGATGTAPWNVLVLEADPRARAELCQTLLLFGFQPQVAVSAAEAAGLCRRQAHVAAFLGLGSDCDSEDTEALCRSLHDAPRGRPVALIAMGDPRRHADRIRMQLAGADRVLARPVGRGDIARALDDCGLRLPRDPRLQR
jgi:CheY-like chemotaxis protein